MSNTIPTTPAVEIRPFVPADGAACATIYTKAARWAFFWTPFPDIDVTAFFAATVGETILVATLHGAVIGFVAFERPDRFIHHLYVDPAHHKLGAGAALLRAAAAVTGPGAHLKCQTRNQTARAFYRAQGWIESDETGGSDASGEWVRIFNPIGLDDTHGQQSRPDMGPIPGDRDDRRQS